MIIKVTFAPTKHAPIKFKVKDYYVETDNMNIAEELAVNEHKKNTFYSYYKSTPFAIAMIDTIKEEI